MPATGSWRIPDVPSRAASLPSATTPLLCLGHTAATPPVAVAKIQASLRMRGKRGSYACDVEVAEGAARAAGEDFPVGSIPFPPGLRPQRRAPSHGGARLAVLDEVESRFALTFEGEPTWRLPRNVHPPVREFGLPREP